MEWWTGSSHIMGAVDVGSQGARHAVQSVVKEHHAIDW
jgi:hypothetical protein